MSNEIKATRVRKIKLCDDPAMNVRVVATAKLKAALKAIAAFGGCRGPRYKWTGEQVSKAEQMFDTAIADAFKNLAGANTNNEPTIQL